MPISDALKFYTEKHAQLLTATASITQYSIDPEANARLVTYVTFGLSKERAGVERAKLSVALNRNQVSIPLFPYLGL